MPNELPEQEMEELFGVEGPKLTSDMRAARMKYKGKKKLLQRELPEQELAILGGAKGG